MRASLPRRNRGSFAIAIAIHVVVVAALVQIVFRYPLGQLMGISEKEAGQERLQFVTLPEQTEHSGGQSAAPTRDAAPAPLLAPHLTPRAPILPSPVAPEPARAAGGTGLGFGVSGSGLATGVVPRQPDARIGLQPGPIVRVPRTVAEDVDSIVSLAIGIVNDSAAMARGQRRPGDWTVKGKDGKVWGWDQSGIRLGKFTIPQALLALLPLNASSGTSPIEARSAAYIRRDVLENGERAISEDDFRAAVKRIRERKEREKRQQQLAADTKDKAP